MTAQHTPAPWVMKITNNLKENTGLIMAGDGTHQICDTGVAYWYNRRAEGLTPEITDPMIERANANALLITAAPDLLEVLKAVVVFLEETDPKTANCISKIRAIIAKAEGK